MDRYARIVFVRYSRSANLLLYFNPLPTASGLDYDVTVLLLSHPIPFCRAVTKCLNKPENNGRLLQLCSPARTKSTRSISIYERAITN